MISERKTTTHWRCIYVKRNIKTRKKGVVFYSYEMANNNNSKSILEIPDKLIQTHWAFMLKYL